MLYGAERMQYHFEINARKRWWKQRAQKNGIKWHRNEGKNEGNQLREIVESHKGCDAKINTLNRRRDIATFARIN